MSRYADGGLASLQPMLPTGEFYTYGTAPPELWPVENPPPLTQEQQDEENEQSQDGSEQAYAEGGDVQGGLSALSDQPMFAQGPGDGRSDDIDAKLSDGEYVVDAETVALLGNGSIEAGAEALDQMRVALRQHKGKELAKGKFSPAAKSPMDYLLGGDE